MSQDPHLRIGVEDIGMIGQSQSSAVLTGQGQVDAVPVKAHGYIHLAAHRCGIEQAECLLAAVGGTLQEKENRSHLARVTTLSLSSSISARR